MSTTSNSTRPFSQSPRPTTTRDEERERDAAATDDAALVRYHATWDQKLRRLQRAHPERWHVAGWSDGEVRDALTLRLIEVVRAGRAAYPEHADDGREWGLSVVTTHLAELRRANRIRSAPMDLRRAPFCGRTPNEEERFLEHEEDLVRAMARARAETTLTKPQRKWLAAMHVAAERGAFFVSSDRINLSEASRVLGKNRSSAQRAYEELRARFVRERDKLD